MSCEISVVHQCRPVFVETVPQGSTAVPPADISNINYAQVCI